MYFHIFSRKTAKSLGTKRYFTGLECKHGHISERYTITGQCIACFEGRGQRPDRIEYQAAYRAENRDVILAGKREHYARSIEKVVRWRKDYINRVGRDEINRARMRYYWENRDQILIDQNRNYRENNDSRRAWQRSYYKKNKDRIQASNKRWAENNPEAAAAASHKVRARRRAADGTFNRNDVVRLMRLQQMKCASCFSDFRKSGKNRYHVDHIVPLARGGTNWPENIQLLCPGCNLRKSARDPYEFAASIGRLF